MKIKNPWYFRGSCIGEFYDCKEKPVRTDGSMDVWKTSAGSFLYTIEGIAVTERAGPGASRELVMQYKN